MKQIAFTQNIKLEKNRGFKTRENYYGVKWIFHLTDADSIFPSVLHAHCEEKSLKLDGFTGQIFDIKTRKKVGKLSKGEIKALHKNEEFKLFTRERIRYYNLQNPNRAIPIPEWAMDKHVIHYSKEMKPVFTDIMIVFGKRRLAIIKSNTIGKNGGKNDE